MVKVKIESESFHFVGHGLNTPKNNPNKSEIVPLAKQHLSLTCFGVCGLKNESEIDASTENKI